MLLDAQPAPPRFREETTREGLRVVVPAVKEWSFVIVLPLFLALLTWPLSHGNSAIYEGVDRNPWTLVKFFGTVIGAIVAFAYWVWMVGGSEVLLFRAQDFEVRQQFLGLARRQNFVPSEIANVRFRQEQGHILMPIPPYHPSALLFDYGGRTYVFARGLDGIDVDRLIALMEHHLPLQPGEKFSSLPS